jgi:ABC-type uncharacterized transport system substrate-binding protein
VAALVRHAGGVQKGLSESGFFEHQNVAIEYRWADGQYERLPAFAADLVRRQAAAILAVGSVPSPLAAKAATSTIPIVFVVSSSDLSPALVSRALPKDTLLWLMPFREGLAESGYRAGSNVSIEYRWADNRYHRIPELLAEVVAQRVSVIVANSPVALAAKAATNTIPIVFTTGEDPFGWASFRASIGQAGTSPE